MGLNALTGIDSFWTELVADYSAEIISEVLTPLRALIVFGHWLSQMVEKGKKVLTPLRALIVFGPTLAAVVVRDSEGS